MRRLKLLIPCLLLVLAAPLNAQDEKSEAMSAAPLEVAANATILDSKGNVIQEGTNGYTCFSDACGPGPPPADVPRRPAGAVPSGPPCSHLPPNGSPARRPVLVHDVAGR